MFSSDLKFSDDHDDFVLDSERTRTNLSTIFGIASEQQDNENTTLKYSPTNPTKNDQHQKIEPQQQNQGKDTQNNKSEWIIQIAKVVTAFKLINQENISQGKLGLTVLKNSEDLRKIILYKSKTNVLSTTTLNDDVKFYIKNSYLQFRDDMNEFWSVLFDQKNDSAAVLELIKDKIFEGTQEQREKPKTSLQTVPSQCIKAQDNLEDESLQESNKNIKPMSDILSRMAKVGQPLPQMATIPSSTTLTITDQSDSSDNEIINTASFSSSKPLVPLRKSKSTTISPQLVTFAHHSQQTISPIMPMMNTINTVSSYSTATPTNLLPSTTDVNFINMLMTENRTQNTEVRMNLTKLETKIEKVLDKFELLEKYGTNSKELVNDKKQKDDLILELEEKLLEYKKENRKLKIKLDEYEEMNAIQQKEKDNENLKTICIDDFVEFKPLLDVMQIQIEDFEKSEDVYKRIIHQVEEEISSLKQQFNDEKLKVKDHEDEIEKLKERNEKQEKVIEEKSTLLQKIEEMKSVISSLEKQNNELSTEKENVMAKLSESTTEIEILQKNKEDLVIKINESLKNSREAVDLKIKEIMNNLYQELVSRFEERKIFTSEEILRICAVSIKRETNNVIQRKS